MKKLTLHIGLMLFVTSLYSQTNPCNLFFEAFNAAQSGFPSFRPGTSDDKVEYAVDSTLLKQYQLSLGKIYIQRNLPVPDQQGKLYTKCTLELLSGWQNAGNKTWTEIRPELEASFVKLCSQYYEACFKNQLAMSPVIEKEPNPLRFLNVFFYNANLKIPEGSDYKSILLGNTYIEFSLQKSFVLNAYTMCYTVETAFLQN